ncbi:MAG TPA: YjbE family putative metal transport protein [Caulobacteraceae bacterium]|nr:YjbE family putative metal transport protein [Caulobacteraceae bacterium]
MHWASLLTALLQVVLIDLTLASDNAIAIGMAAAGLPRAQRRQAIALGLGGAVVLICGLAIFAIRLLKAGGPGLILAGGLLLLLICWQMWKDLRARRSRGHREAAGEPPSGGKTLLAALVQIFIADVSTSMDNVLAVAGAVRDQPPWVLFVGLGLSVVMTGFAAAWVARLLHRWPWIGYIGLAIVLFVSGRMIWDGVVELGWLKAFGV